MKNNKKEKNKKQKDDNKFISEQIAQKRKEFYRTWHKEVEEKAEALGISKEEYIKRFKPKKNNRGDLWLGGKGLN